MRNKTKRGKRMKIAGLWFLSMIVLLPVVLSLCKSAKTGDECNKLIYKNGESKCS